VRVEIASLIGCADGVFELLHRISIEMLSGAEAAIEMDVVGEHAIAHLHGDRRDEHWGGIVRG